MVVFYSPAQLVRGFTLSDLLVKPWSQVCLLLPPPPELAFIFIPHRVQHSQVSAVFARHSASNFSNSRSRAFCLSICKKQSLVRFEPTTLTSLVTRLTGHCYVAEGGDRLSLQVCQLSMSSALLSFFSSEGENQVGNIFRIVMTSGQEEVMPFPPHDCSEYKTPS